MPDLVDAIQYTPTPAERDEFSAQQRKAAEQFSRQMLQAGATVLAPDGQTVLKPRRVPAPSEPMGAATPGRVVEVDVPAAADDDYAGRVFIDLDIDDVQEKVITLHRQSGDDIVLRIPPLRTDSAYKVLRLQYRIGKLLERLVKTGDMKEVDRINTEVLHNQRELVRLGMPEFPIELLPGLTPRALARIANTINQFVAEATGDPNDVMTYLRLRYARAKHPHGANDAGLTRWVREHLDAVEDASEDDLDPNS